jgi:hypothetical protein
VISIAILILVSLGIVVLLLMPDAVLRDRLVLTRIDRTTYSLDPRTFRLAQILLTVSSIGCLSAAALLLARFEQAKRLALYVLEDLQKFWQQVYRTAQTGDVSDSRWHATSLITFLVLGAILRLKFLFLPISYDESHTFTLFASRTLFDVISDYSAPNSHIFHTLLAHLSIKAFGISPSVLRLPAFAAGMLTIPAAYWLMRQLFDARTALLTAGLVAVGPPLVEYSAEARGYTFQALFFLMGFSIASHLRDRSSVTGWGLFSIVFTLGILTIPTMLYGFISIGIWILLTSRQAQRNRTALRLGLATLATGFGVLLCYTPALMRTGLPPVLHVTWNEFPAQLFATSRSVMNCWTGYLPMPVKGVLGLGLVSAILPLRMNRSVMLILGAIVAGGLPLMILQRVVPPPRALHFLFPIFAGVSAFGLQRMFGTLLSRRQSTLESAWIVTVLLISGVWFSARLLTPLGQSIQPGTDWRGSAELGAADVLGIKCCGQGYFADAETTAEQFKQMHQAGDADALVAFSWAGGMNETTRFYLMRSGLSPTFVHPYQPLNGLEQLEIYRRFLVVIRRPQGPAADSDTNTTRHAVLEMLRCSQAEFDEMFYAPTLIGHYLVSDLYRVESRHPPSAAPSMEELSSNIFYVW